MFLAGLMNFIGLSNLPLRVKNFIRFIKKLGAWEHGHHIIADGFNYKYDSISCQHVPYNPNEEQDIYRNQLFDTRDCYHKKIKTFL
jgi:hypothetical protein